MWVVINSLGDGHTHARTHTRTHMRAHTHSLTHTHTHAHAHKHTHYMDKSNFKKPSVRWHVPIFKQLHSYEVV